MLALHIFTKTDTSNVMSKIESSEHGRALAELGASKGGKARIALLSPRERSNLARQAAISRWAKEGKEPPLFAEYGSPERPLRIGTIEIPCYVLMDGRRVLAQRGLQSGIGLSEGGGKGGARKIAGLMHDLATKGIDIKDLALRANSPIRFILPRGASLLMVMRQQFSLMFVQSLLRRVAWVNLVSASRIWLNGVRSYSMALRLSE